MKRDFWEGGERLHGSSRATTKSNSQRENDSDSAYTYFTAKFITINFRGRKSSPITPHLLAKQTVLTDMTSRTRLQKHKKQNLIVIVKGWQRQSQHTCTAFDSETSIHYQLSKSAKQTNDTNKTKRNIDIISGRGKRKDIKPRRFVDVSARKEMGPR